MIIWEKCEERKERRRESLYIKKKAVACKIMIKMGQGEENIGFVLWSVHAHFST